MKTAIRIMMSGDQVSAISLALCAHSKLSEGLVWYSPDSFGGREMTLREGRPVHPNNCDKANDIMWFGYSQDKVETMIWTSASSKATIVADRLTEGSNPFSVRYVNGAGDHESQYLRVLLEAIDLQTLSEIEADDESVEAVSLIREILEQKFRDWVTVTDKDSHFEEKAEIVGQHLSDWDLDPTAILEEVLVSS